MNNPRARRKASSLPDRWEAVRRSLHFTFVSEICVFLANLVLAFFVYVLILGSQNPSTNREVKPIITTGCLIAAAVAVVAFLCALAGQMRFCMVQAETGAKDWAAVALFLYLVSIGGGIGIVLAPNWLDRIEEERQTMRATVGEIAIAAAVCGHLAFVFVVGRIGRFLGNDAVVRLAIASLVGCSLLLAGSIGYSFFLRFSGASYEPRSLLAAYISAVKTGTDAKTQDGFLSLADARGAFGGEDFVLPRVVGQDDKVVSQVLVFGIPTMSGLLGLWMFLQLVKKTRDVVAQALDQLVDPEEVPASL